MKRSRDTNPADGAAGLTPPRAEAAGIEPAVEWLRRQGHRVIVSPSACWYDPSPGFYQAFPYHPPVSPSEDELRRVFRDSRALGLRYSAPIGSPVGKVSYHAVYAEPEFNLDKVSRQARQNIRKGLDYVTVEPVSFSRLAGEGWTLRADTLARQDRLKAENRAWWRRMCLSAEGLPGFHAWGALRDGKLVGALFGCLTRDTFLMLYQQSLTEHLKFGINNTLGFVATQKALAIPGVRQVFYGLESLDAPSGVDTFKFRMGFTAEPVRQRVLFHPALRFLVRPVTLAALERFGSSFSRNPRLLKAAGMVRFCLEGMRPPAEQNHPECLLDRREEWLGKTT